MPALFDIKIYLRHYDNDDELVLDGIVPTFLVSKIIENYSGVNFRIKILPTEDLTKEEDF